MVRQLYRKFHLDFFHNKTGKVFISALKKNNPKKSLFVLEDPSKIAAVAELTFGRFSDLG
jgi:hypothetical protein